MANATSRQVGATASGSPTIGSYLVGDWVVDQTGSIWICTGGGTPGVWSRVGGSTGLPAGGSAGQVLTKNSDTAYDAGWSAPASAVTSVDGRTGVVTLNDLYVDVAGDTMAGNLGLGFPSPTAKLQFAADTTAAGGISFGTDTTLYRSAPDTLATDDTFVAGQVVQAALSTTTGGFRQGTSGPVWLAGPGSPEGAVVAPVGSIYSRLDGSADTAVYRKETGTGNTGWVPVADVYVSPNAPPGTPNVGDQWYDTDEPAGLTFPVTIASGGTGATSASAARSNLLVNAGSGSTSTAGAPTTGTWARGDHWIDSGGYLWVCTVAGTPGAWYSPPRGVLAYVESTATVTGIGTAVADITDLVTPSIALTSGRRYELSAMVTFFKPSTSANVELWITESNNYMWHKTVDWVNGPGHVTAIVSVPTTTTMSGNYVFKCRAVTDNGTVNTIGTKHWIMVKDMGA